MPKKVLEAKNRKKKRLARQMEKIKKKAQVISNQEEIGEGSKIRQIDKLYKRELSKNKEEKKYIVIRGKQKTGRNSRSVKYVDKRLKKDKRGVKRAERKNKDLYKRKNIKKQQTLNKKKGGKGGKGKK
jgi:AdoMet-dependent rRNA methyltransferase SPB1